MSIDRRALVSRHDPSLTSSDPYSPLSVGNGEFAFTADATGLQTILPAAEGAIPLCAIAQWGWHSYPLAPGEDRARSRLRLQDFKVDGRHLGYMTDPSGQEALFSALRVNPHRLNLARLGFVVAEGGQPGDSGQAQLADQSLPASRSRPAYVEPLPADIGSIAQRLHLWEGLLDSGFTLRGATVKVMTAVHPFRDILSFRAESSAFAEGKLAVRLSFPYGSHDRTASDWKAPGRHSTDELPVRGTGRRLLMRRLDEDRYFVALRFGPGVAMERAGSHEFLLTSSGNALEASIEFSSGAATGDLPSWDDCRAAAATWWADYWGEGGMVELAGSADPRAFELERRIILSQYLTAIQCAGSLPPQETGLTCNSWYGKFHLEMHYWHAAHFAQWGRAKLLERSLGWYRSILDSARERAASQGCRGARWPKMTDSGGEDSPSPIGPFLCWQQPHPIMYVELLRRAGLPREALAPFAELISETAEFMADFARPEGDGTRIVLGPPLIPAQECHSPTDTLNPTFELEYWRWGLETALSLSEWLGGAGEASAARQRLQPTARWRKALAKLASPTAVSIGDGARLYLAHELCADTFERHAVDHPSMLLALGMLPGKSIDRPAMSATYDKVLETWNFETCWGWDFPAMAMTAARLGRPGDAVAALLMNTPKNTYRPDGHNAQGKDARLPLYLPGNGALLLAVGMMAAGWDGCGDTKAPGFPGDGSWKVTVEGIVPLP